MSMLSFNGETDSCTVVFLSGYLSSGVVFSKLLDNVSCIHTQEIVIERRAGRILSITVAFLREYYQVQVHSSAEES